MNSTSRVRLTAAIPFFILFAFCVSLSGFFALPALGGTFTLIDDNSSMSFDTGDPNEPANASSWIVDGVNQLYEQAFWYRVGGGGESSVHGLPIDAEGTSDVNFDGDDETLFVRYDGGNFEIEILYTLDGGTAGSGASDMAEQISINSKVNFSQNFHFFQYTDFEVGGDSDDDLGVFTNANSVRQSDPSVRLTETIITPVPSHRELSAYSAIRDSLEDALPTTLSDTPAIGTGIGPLDLTWAFQWDFTLQPFSTFQISKDKNMAAIPEPASLVLLMVGGLAYFGRRR